VAEGARRSGLGLKTRQTVSAGRGSVFGFGGQERIPCWNMRLRRGEESLDGDPSGRGSGIASGGKSVHKEERQHGQVCEVHAFSLLGFDRLCERF